MAGSCDETKFIITCMPMCICVLAYSFRSVLNICFCTNSRMLPDTLYCQHKSTTTLLIPDFHVSDYHLQVQPRRLTSFPGSSHSIPRSSIVACNRPCSYSTRRTRRLKGAMTLTNPLDMLLPYEVLLPFALLLHCVILLDCVILLCFDMYC